MGRTLFWGIKKILNNVAFHFEFGPFKMEKLDFLTTCTHLMIPWTFYFNGS